MNVSKISIEIDLAEMFPGQNKKHEVAIRIREKKDAGARFTTARSDHYISNVTIWTGKGRDRQERKINLSIPQGKFLFHLPFPSAEYKSVGTIMGNAEVGSDSTSEVLDIVNLLIGYGVIEKESGE